jgi:hypothetical protein
MNNQIIPLDTDKSIEGLVQTKAQQWLKDTFAQNTLADMAYVQLANNSIFNFILTLNLLLLFIEMVLVSYDFETSYIGQIVILAISTFNFFILFSYPIYNIWKSNKKVNYIWQGIVCESLIEIFFLITGWVALGLHSPLASFRCFRIIRYLWYSEYYTVTRNHSIIYFYVIFYSHLLLQYVDNIRVELFTTKTKGALGVITLYFFLAYVFAVVYTHATRNMPLISPEGGTSGHISQCDTLSHCYYIMIKISNWDGNGFDYWKSLLFHHSILANFLGVMLGFYVFIMDFIILNGILGIFAGGVFANVAQEEVKNNILLQKLNSLINLQQQQQFTSPV